MLLTLLALAPVLQGCALLPRLPHTTLHIDVVPLSGTAGTGSSSSTELTTPLMEAFRRLHPEVHLRIRQIPEKNLTQELILQRRRGLGPDLLLVRAPVAVALRRQGLIDAVPDNPAMRQAEASIEPAFLERVRERGELFGLPVANEITLACYDRRRVAEPPRTLEQLAALAASGRPVGLSIEPIGLWWTTGPFGADDALAPMITDQPPDPGFDVRVGLQSMVRWLQWLRMMAQQSRVDIATGPEDLERGLVSGRLAWIPCYSLSLQGLQKAMGPRLGVAVLPGGPAGPASPFTSERVWAFGRDSSPGQRGLAEELARLSINPMLQRQITMENQAAMPVNRYVDVPVADSGRLAAMAEAQNQFRISAKALGRPFSASRVRMVLPEMEQLIFQAMVGVLTPEQAARALLDLGRRA